MNLYKACEAITTMNVLWRTPMFLSSRRFCAKCKNELYYSYLENRNYVIYCKVCDAKTIVKAGSEERALDVVGIKKEE